MRLLPLIVAFAALAITPLRSVASVFITVENNRLVTNFDGAPARIYLANMGEHGFANFTDDPAFTATVLTPGEQIGLVALGPIHYWDPSDNFWRYPIDSDEMIDIRDGQTLLTTMTGVTGRRDLGAFAEVGVTGSLSDRLEFGLRRPCGCLVAFGVYALRLQLTSNLHEPSEPFVVLFFYFIDEDTVADAQAAAPTLLDGPACGGDFDLDGQVGLSDLAQTLAHFGLIGAMPREGDMDGDADVDLGDLTSFLANFGTICTP